MTFNSGPLPPPYCPVATHLLPPPHYPVAVRREPPPYEVARSFLADPQIFRQGVPLGLGLADREVTLRSPSRLFPEKRPNNVRTHNPYGLPEPTPSFEDLSVFTNSLRQKKVKELINHEYGVGTEWDCVFAEKGQDPCLLEQSVKTWKSIQSSLRAVSPDEQLYTCFVFVSRIMSFYGNNVLSKLSREEDQNRREKAFRLVWEIHRVVLNCPNTDFYSPDIFRLYLGRVFRCQTLLFNYMTIEKRREIEKEWTPRSFLTEMKTLSERTQIAIPGEVLFSSIKVYGRSPEYLKAIIKDYTYSIERYLEENKENPDFLEKVDAFKYEIGKGRQILHQNMPRGFTSTLNKAKAILGLIY